VQPAARFAQAKRKGFGAASAEQARQVWRFADAAVIGSAIVREIERLDNSPELV